MITVNTIRKEFRISNEECCNNTICNAIKKHGLLWKSRRKKATYGKQCRRNRLKHCKAMLKWSDKKLQRLVFIDGCTVHWPRSVKAMRDTAKFHLGDSVWRKGSEGLHKDCVGPSTYARSQGGALKIWGMAGWKQGRDGKAVFKASPLPPQNSTSYKVVTTSRRLSKKKKGKKGVRQSVPKKAAATTQVKTIPKNQNSVSMNKRRFADWVNTKLVKWLRELGFSTRREDAAKKGPILVMDKERCLHAPESKRLLRSHGITILKSHPTSSPDLNAIETLWAKMKARVFSSQGFPTKIARRDFWGRRVQNAIRDMNSHQGRDSIANMTWRSMKSRCRAVIENDGGKTEY